MLQRVRSMSSARIGGLMKSRVRDFAVAGDGAQDTGDVQAKVEGAPTGCSTTEAAAVGHMCLTYITHMSESCQTHE